MMQYHQIVVVYIPSAAGRQPQTPGFILSFSLGFIRFVVLVFLLRDRILAPEIWKVMS